MDIDVVNKVDALLMPAIKDRGSSVPPASPSEGDRYLVAAGGSEDWNGHDGELAVYYDEWIFITPKEGWTFWVDDEDREIVYDGSTWNSTVMDKISVYLSGAQSIATGAWVQITFDTEEFDVANHFAANKFTAVRAGYYHIEGRAYLVGLDADEEAGVAIYKNGSFICVDVRWAPNATKSVSVGVSKLVYLVPTDYIDLRAYHNHGSNRNIDSAQGTTFMTIIGPF